MVCSPREGHADVHDPCYHQCYVNIHVLCCCLKPCWCQWAVLLVGGHGNFCGLCCHRKTRGSSWCMLLLTVKDKESSSAVILMTSDSQLRTRDIEDFWGNLFPIPLSPSLKKKGIHWRELLKTVIEMLKCKLFRVDGSWVDSVITPGFFEYPYL